MKRYLPIMTTSIDAHSQAQSYEKSGFGNLMGWGSKPVLLLIDVCKAYWQEGSPLDCSKFGPAAAAPASMRKLVAAARSSRTPIMWTTVEYTDPDMKDAGLFYVKSKLLNVFHSDDPRGLGRWVDGLIPEKGEMVIKKKYASAFFGTTLATDLSVLGADTVVLCGVSTSGCVRASTLDAMQYGYRPMVSSQSPCITIIGSRRVANKLRWLDLPVETGAKRFTIRIFSI